ncbi:MFS transporter [Streptomyces sp. NBC_00385]|uniref:MFS transporter n=1 Tax=Streptomyces sp. NBC_00385 TaxID=2975733 RepID=UPI002DD87C52|nr:MFS transporter [Streptomyces sp. NBC_00385]WRZ01917.1 MFS transporter [Streptomyces sp. NBC_00385]
MSDAKIAPATREEGPSGFTGRYVLILISLLLSVQLLPIMGLLSGNAQSEIAIHFGTTRIAWFTLITALVGTFVLPFAAKAAGLYGKKRVMVIATALGLVGDVIAAMSTSYDMLLLGRGIAGLYTVAMPLAYAMARDVFPRRLVGPASGVLGGGVGLVALVGPFLSGYLLDHHGFRGSLWFMAVATAVNLLLLLVFVPESPVREDGGRMDWLGGLLLGGGLTSIVYAIGEGSHWGWTSGKLCAFVGLGLVALIAFFLVQRRVASPLLPLSLLTQRKVWTVFLATSVAAGAVYSVGVVMQLLALMPQIPGLSDGLGWSATKNAQVTAPMSIIILVMAVVTGTLARRIDTRLLLGIGGAFTAVGYGLGSQIHHSVSDIVTFGLVAGVGMGIIVSIIPIMVIGAVGPKDQAVANGAQNLLQSVAQVIVTQIAFVIMSQNGKVMKGTQFYVDSGFTNAFWLISAVGAVGALLVLLIPKVKKLDEAEVGQAAL